MVLELHVDLVVVLSSCGPVGVGEVSHEALPHLDALEVIEVELVVVVRLAQSYDPTLKTKHNYV